MGEAKRRKEKGLAPRGPKQIGSKAKADTPYIWTKKTDSNWDVTAVKE